MSLDLLEHLLRSAVQGSRLRVTWSGLYSGGPVQACLDLHEEIIKQQGEDKTPRLEAW
jgi:hypothetical protein